MIIGEGMMKLLFEAHESYISGCVALGEILVSASGDGTVKMWLLPKGDEPLSAPDCLYTSPRHNGPLTGLTAVDEHHVVAWSHAGELSLFDTRIRQQLHTFPKAEYFIRGLLPLDNGRFVVWSYAGAQLWDWRSGRLLAHMGRGGLCHYVCQFPHEGPLAIIMDKPAFSPIHLHNPTTGENVGELSGHADTLLASATPLGNGLLLGDAANNLHWFTPDALQHSWQGHKQALCGFTIVANGHPLSWAHKGEFLLWDFERPLPQPLPGHRKQGRGGLSLSGYRPFNDCCFVTWADDGLIRLWSRGQSRATAVLRGHEGAVNGCAWLNDHLLSWGEDGSLRQWNTQTHQLVTILNQHRGPITGLRITPQNQLITFGTQKQIGLAA